MQSDERRALSAALRWARLHGWQYRWCGFEYGAPNAHNPENRVQWAANERRLILRNPDRVVKMTVVSVAQALDLLVAYGLLPMTFRSVEPGGWEQWTVYRRTDGGHRGAILGTSDNSSRAAEIAAQMRAVGVDVLVTRTRYSPVEDVDL